MEQLHIVEVTIKKQKKRIPSELVAIISYLEAITALQDLLPVKQALAQTGEILQFIHNLIVTF